MQREASQAKASYSKGLLLLFYTVLLQSAIKTRKGWLSKTLILIGWAVAWYLLYPRVRILRPSAFVGLTVLSRLLASRNISDRETEWWEKNHGQLERFLLTGVPGGKSGPSLWSRIEMPWERSTQKEVLLQSSDQMGEKKKPVAGLGRASLNLSGLGGLRWYECTHLDAPLQFLLPGMLRWEHLRWEHLHQSRCNNQLPTSWGPSSMKLREFNFHLVSKTQNKDLHEEPFGTFPFWLGNTPRKVGGGLNKNFWVNIVTRWPLLSPFLRKISRKSLNPDHFPASERAEHPVPTALQGQINQWHLCPLFSSEASMTPLISILPARRRGYRNWEVGHPTGWEGCCVVSAN